MEVMSVAEKKLFDITGRHFGLPTTQLATKSLFDLLLLKLSNADHLESLRPEIELTLVQHWRQIFNRIHINDKPLSELVSRDNLTEKSLLACLEKHLFDKCIEQGHCQSPLPLNVLLHLIPGGQMFLLSNRLQNVYTASELEPGPDLETSYHFSSSNTGIAVKEAITVHRINKESNLADSQPGQLAHYSTINISEHNQVNCNSIAFQNQAGPAVENLFDKKVKKIPSYGLLSFFPSVSYLFGSQEYIDHSPAELEARKERAAFLKRVKPELAKNIERLESNLVELSEQLVNIKKLQPSLDSLELDYEQLSGAVDEPNESQEQTANQTCLTYQKQLQIKNEEYKALTAKILSQHLQEIATNRAHLSKQFSQLNSGFVPRSKHHQLPHIRRDYEQQIRKFDLAQKSIEQTMEKLKTYLSIPLQKINQTVIQVNNLTATLIRKKQKHHQTALKAIEQDRLATEQKLMPINTIKLYLINAINVLNTKIMALKVSQKVCDDLITQLKTPIEQHEFDRINSAIKSLLALFSKLAHNDNYRAASFKDEAFNRSITQVRLAIEHLQASQIDAQQTAERTFNVLTQDIEQQLQLAKKVSEQDLDELVYPEDYDQNLPSLLLEISQLECEALENCRQEVREVLRKYSHSVTNAFSTGWLVKQNHGDEVNTLKKAVKHACSIDEINALLKEEYQRISSKREAGTAPHIEGGYEKRLREALELFSEEPSISTQLCI